MLTTILSILAALLKAIPEILRFWERADQKRNEADALRHKDEKRNADDATVDSALGMSNSGSRPTGEQPKNPHDFFPGVD